MVASTFSNRSVEEIGQAATQTLWLSSFMWKTTTAKPRSTLSSRKPKLRFLLPGLLCITVDLSWKYARDREDHVADETPVLPYPNLNYSSRPGGSGRNIGRSRTFSWKDLEWIRSFAKTPVLLKGILNPDERRERAARDGVAAVSVGVLNYGGQRARHRSRNDRRAPRRRRKNRRPNPGPGRWRHPPRRRCAQVSGSWRVRRADRPSLSVWLERGGIGRRAPRHRNPAHGIRGRHGAGRTHIGRGD